MANVNLIPQDQATRSSWQKYSMTSLITAIVVVAVIVGGLFIYQRILIVREATLQINIANVQEEQMQYDEVAKEAGTLQKQLGGLRSILENHVYWSELFWAMEETALKDTVINSFQANDPGQVSLLGSTPSYGKLAKQIVSFMSTPFFSDYSLRSAILAAGEGGATGVDFVLELQVADNALRKDDAKILEDSLRTIDITEPAAEVVGVEGEGDVVEEAATEEVVPEVAPPE